MGSRMGMGIAIDGIDCPNPHIGPLEGEADGSAGYQPKRPAPPPHGHISHDHHLRDLVGGCPARNRGHSLGACVSIFECLA